MGKQTYDRSIKKFNEPHSPEQLTEMVKSKKINYGKFLNKRHSGSYYEQIRVMWNLKVKSVLEVGPGEGYVARNLRASGVKYDTLDFEDIHKPTIQADFNKFDPSDYKEKYELTCGFQVLEHFPFEDFPRLLEKLAIMSSKYVYISLPYSCYGFHLQLGVQPGQIPVTKKIRFYIPTFKRGRKYRKEFMEEFPWAVHYWEIGRRGFSYKKVRKTIESCNLKVVDSFHGPNPFHFYFLCEKV